MGTSIDKFITGLLIVVFLSACGVNLADRTSGDQPSTGITLLKIITQSTGVISAFISIDGGARQVMVENRVRVSCGFVLNNDQMKRAV